MDRHAAGARGVQERGDEDARCRRHPPAAVRRTGAAAGAGPARREVRRIRRARSRRASIPWGKLPGAGTPRVLAELKNAVMKMRDAADIRLLRFAELAQRLEQALPGEP